MDTRWKNIKAMLEQKEVNKDIALGAAVAFTVSFVWAMCQVPHVYNVVGVILSFLTGVIGIVFGVRYAVIDITEKNATADGEIFLHAYTKLRGIVLAVCLVYVCLLTVLLQCGEFGVRGIEFHFRIHGQYGSFLDDLITYRMTWIAIGLYLVPIISSFITLTVECDKERGRRAYLFEVEAIREKARAESLRVDLLTNVAHDLKTPLTAMVGYLALMEKEELSPEMKDYVQICMQKSELLKEMIEKVSELSKASSGNAELSMEKLDLSRLVRQVAADVCDTYSSEKRDFKYELADDLFFKGDSVYAYTIVQNLFVNAVKYSMEHTRIFVKTYADNGQIVLEVINVSAEPIDVEADKLKERFVRGDASRSTEGNGLGLAIVDTYTHALGGAFHIGIVGDTFKAEIHFDSYANL